MTDAEFMNLMGGLRSYLEEKKVFVKNPARFAEVERATEIAAELFDSAEISVTDDVLQLGSLVIHIDAYDITIRGKRELNLFSELVSKADNFEIYPVGDEKLKFALMFNNALIRLP